MIAHRPVQQRRDRLVAIELEQIARGDGGAEHAASRRGVIAAVPQRIVRGSTGARHHLAAERHRGNKVLAARLFAFGHEASAADTTGGLKWNNASTSTSSSSTLCDEIALANAACTAGTWPA